MTVLCEMLNGMLYRLRSGCPWRAKSDEKTQHLALLQLALL